MIALSKWAIWVTVIACVLISVCLIVDHFTVEIAPKQVNLLSSKSLPDNTSKPLPDNIAKQQLAHGLGLWRDNKYQQASQAFSLLGSKYLSANMQALTDLYQFHATDFNKDQRSGFSQHVSTLPDDCKQKLLFVTANIESLPQAEHFRKRFSKDPRMNALSICIYDMTWFDPVDISCDENWQQSGRLGCRLLSLAKKLKKLPFTHLVMFADKGKANVHNGIMFLDRMDTYDVFIHELAHFSGFIDEYPLTHGLAKRVCGGVDAPNMVFKRAEQTQVDRHYWQLIGLENSTDIFAARTCDNHATQAFKASKQLTFMEYHDTAFIPAHYLTAWQMQLQQTPNQPSAHINFAQLYERSNNLSESQFWRAKYQQYLLPAVNQFTNL